MVTAEETTRACKEERRNSGNNGIGTLNLFFNVEMDTFDKFYCSFLYKLQAL